MFVLAVAASKLARDMDTGTVLIHGTGKLHQI